MVIDQFVLRARIVKKKQIVDRLIAHNIAHFRTTQFGVCNITKARIAQHYESFANLLNDWHKSLTTNVNHARCRFVSVVFVLANHFGRTTCVALQQHVKTHDGVRKHDAVFGWILDVNPARYVISGCLQNNVVSLF
jgi:hypothetical protein